MKRILLVISSVLLIACGQEEKQPLPDLPKIEAPTSLVGSYSGRLPAENAKAHQIQLELDSLGNAILTERILRDSLEIFTDTLTYRDSSGVLSFHFKESSRKLRFKKIIGQSGIEVDESWNTVSLDDFEIIKRINE